MRKNYLKAVLVMLLCVISTNIFAQAPQRLNYQGIARNGGGQPLANQALGLRITIQDGTPTTFYQETHTVTTNAYGLYNVVIGNGTAVTGTMSAATWLSGDRYINVEMDPAGGTAYVPLGTPTQMISVPYAMGANSVQATSNGGGGLIGTTTSSLWWGFYEAGAYRGYLGSYSGKNEDVDFGTGGGNTIGSVHLVVAAVPKLTVDSIGNVGIGTRFPKYRLQVDGITGSFNENGIRINNTTANSGWSFYSSSSGALIVGRTGNLGQFDGTTGVYTSLSDARLKTNIETMEPIMSKVMNLSAKRYEFRYDNPTHRKTIGFLAQDIQAVFPEYVFVNTTNEGNPKVENQLSVDYAGMSVIAIKAIQEQQAIIIQLQQQVAQLQSQVSRLMEK